MDTACGEMTYLPVTTQKHEIKNNAPHLSTRSDSVDKRIVLPSLRRQVIPWSTLKSEEDQPEKQQAVKAVAPLTSGTVTSKFQS